MKLCKVCNQLKPYDPTAKRQSKAQGFVGHVCWDCVVKAQRMKMQERSGSQNPKLQALKAQRHQLSIQMRALQRAEAFARIEARGAAEELAYLAYQARAQAKLARK